MTEYRRRRASGQYAPGSAPAQPVREGELDDLTRDQLIERAAQLGIDVQANATKAEIRAAIEEG
jgi:hypothetical protein